MYIIDITYTQAIDVIEQHLAAHRDYLREKYAQGFLVMSGPKNPREGGVIIATAETRAEIDDIINNDPFKINNVADYSVTEFNPVLHQLDNAKL